MTSILPFVGPKVTEILLAILTVGSDQDLESVSFKRRTQNVRARSRTTIQTMETRALAQVNPIYLTTFVAVEMQRARRPCCKSLLYISTKVFKEEER